MDPAAETKPARRGFRRIAWICWCILGPLGVLVLLNVCFVVYEMSSVRPPKFKTALPAITLVTEKDRPTSTTMRLATMTIDIATTNDAAQADFVSLRNGNSAAVNAKIRELNAAFRKTKNDLAAYLKDEPNLSFDEAKQRSDAIGAAWKSSLTGPFYFQQPSVVDPGPDTVAAQLKVISIDEIYHQMRIDLGVRHEQWQFAADECRITLQDDDRIYYLKKMGGPGYRIIVWETTKTFWRKTGEQLSIWRHDLK